MLIIDREIAKIFENTIKKLYNEKETKKVEVSVATNEKFGDFQTNFAMMNSKIIGKNPRTIAQEILDNLEENDVIDKLEIAGPGFINIFLKSKYLGEVLKKSRTEEYDFSFLNREGDVIIDFSHYSRLDSLLDYSKNKKIPLVVATTGYSDETLKKIKKTAEVIPVLLSSNMSLGVNLLNDILERIVPVLYENYDIEVVEKHHNKKVDSPSGTAKTLVETIEKSCPENMREQYGREGNSKREKYEIGIHSLRGGTIVGEHSVLFCGEDEIIEIKHTAMSKKIFVVGALKAAEFLIGKEAGLYTMKDIFGN